MSIDDAWGDHDWDEAESEPLAEGELAAPAKRALAMVLQRRFITRSVNRNVWEVILANRHDIETHLTNMYFDLVLDDFYGVAFKRQSRNEEAIRMLRADNIGRDASFLLIHLRKEFAYQDGTDEPVVVNREQVEEFLRPFVRQPGSRNDEKFDNRVEAAINAVDKLGLLSRRTDVDYLYEVSPAIVPLMGDEEFKLLQKAYEDEVKRYAVPVSPATPKSDETAVDTDDLSIGEQDEVPR